MTEKRFIETISTGIVHDNQTGKKYNCEYRINDEFLELINTLAEENQLLIEDTEKHRKLAIQFDNRNKELVSENALLEKENEQLKQQKQILYGEIDLLKSFIEKQGFKVKLDSDVI